MKFRVKGTNEVIHVNGLAPKKKKSKSKTKEELLLEVLDDPLAFVALCWPHLKLYDKQRDILQSLLDNTETFVHAANEMGKDFIGAIACIWWFVSRKPARVITSSSGEKQLKSILWSEIKQRIADSVIPLPLDVHHLEIRRKLPDGTVDPMSYIVGQVTNTIENFQGHHLDHDRPRILAFFDEASGIADEFYDAADSWAHKKLVVGNPLNTTNWFYRFCKKGDRPRVDGMPGLFRKVIHISGEDSPNVIYGKALREAGVPGPYKNIIPGVLSYSEFVQKEEEWDKIKKHMRLYGHFYEGEEALLFPPDWLDLSEKRYLALEKEKTKRYAKAMGVDGAEGRDLTCWTIIDELGIITQIAKQTPNTADIGSYTLALMRDYGLEPNQVYFDHGGGGKQIADHLRAKNVNVRSVIFGSNASPQRPPKMRRGKMEATERSQAYKNRRVEMYAELRTRLNPSISDPVFAIPAAYTALRQELAIMPLLYDEEGRMYLPPKERKPTQKEGTVTAIATIRQMLGRSPDRVDSLVLAIFALKHQSSFKFGALR